jgi:polyferredoxin
VWAGVNFSRPAIRTGTSFPASSICGGRPGLKIKSLTLSDAVNISRKMAMKFNGGAVGGWLVTFGCWLLILILELFALVVRQKITLANKLVSADVHQSRRYTVLYRAAR